MRHNFLDDPEPVLHTQRYQVSFLTSDRQYVLCISVQNSLQRINILVLVFIWIKRILFNQKCRYQPKILLPFQQLFQHNISQVLCLRVLSYQRAFVEQGSATNTVHHIYERGLLDKILFLLSPHTLKSLSPQIQDPSQGFCKHACQALDRPCYKTLCALLLVVLNWLLHQTCKPALDAQEKWFKTLSWTRLFLLATLLSHRLFSLFHVSFVKCQLAYSVWKCFENTSETSDRSFGQTIQQPCEFLSLFYVFLLNIIHQRTSTA